MAGFLRKRMRSVGLRATAAVLLTAAGLFTAAPGVFAAGVPTVSEMSFQSSQLGFILGGISKAFDVNFSVSSAAAAKVVSLHFKTETTLDDLLDMLRTTAGVSIEECRPRSYIVRTNGELQGDTQGMSEKEKEIFETERRISKGITRTFILNYVKAADAASAISKAMGENAKNVFSVSVLGGDDDSDDEDTGILENETREYSTILVYAVNENIMSHIEALITAIDMPKPLVEVEAVFVEVSQNDNRDIGFDWSIMPDPIQFVESSIGTTIVDGTEAVPIFNKTNLGQMRRTSAASGSVTANLTESNSRGRVLSNPRIRVMSGHVAGFSSETQVPIMNKDSDGEVTTEYKNVGISLDILPVVLENDQIYLTVKPTVSAITDTVVLGETQAPQIAERTAETTLLMRDGETMVIGGLLSDRDIKTLNKVPFLHKIPLFGALFKSEGVTKEHSSISVYLRLRLIKDYMGAPRVKREISNAAVNKLLTGLSDAELAAAGKNRAGGFKEKVTVQGVLPVAMKEPAPARVEILPIETGPAPASAPAAAGKPEETAGTPAAAEAVKPEEAPAPGGPETAAQDRDDWRERYDRLIRDMQRREAEALEKNAEAEPEAAAPAAEKPKPEAAVTAEEAASEAAVTGTQEPPAAPEASKQGLKESEGAAGETGRGVSEFLY